jgi:hypothetical protein
LLFGVAAWDAVTLAAVAAVLGAAAMAASFAPARRAASVNPVQELFEANDGMGQCRSDAGRTSSASTSAYASRRISSS